ncbi:MAG: ABC transporter ATP-binding protein [Lachnospiraceae bacterium]|nr:ABC transporter ATP-binding protein [Lachnospiraceae bacterium]
MKPENAIEVHDIRKSFKVFLDKGHTLKELALFKKRRTHEEREVLRGISFEVKKGEAIGLIGHNGCGKSTTLKLLTRIMYPDSGHIEMNGRVSSLIELGAGFHPDMSGRENIYTNASIFGLTRKEIDERVDDIIAFSELEQYIDNPVRTYSSGMYMRLAFAVAINVNADILLIDEILAVGDINFQAKCFNKLREIKGRGTTIVIVSHSMDQIEKICERSIWIHDGEIKAEGSPRDVHPQYFEFMGKERQAIAENEKSRIESKSQKEIEPEEQQDNEILPENSEKRWGTGEARILEVKCFNQDGEETFVYKTGTTVRIQVKYEVKKPIKEANFGVGIFRTDGVHCYGTNTQIDKLNKFDLTESGMAELILEQLELLPGEYDFDFAIGAENCTDIDYCKSFIRLQVYSEKSDVGIARIAHAWSNIK